MDQALKIGFHWYGPGERKAVFHLIEVKKCGGCYAPHKELRFTQHPQRREEAILQESSQA
jgi:hypothetical protein